MTKVDMKKRTAGTAKTLSGSKRATVKVNANAKSRARGAVREKSRQSGLWKTMARSIKRAGIAITVSSLVGGVIFLGYGFVERAVTRPVQNIGIEGNFQFLRKAEVADLIEPMVEGGFLQIPIDRIKAEVEKNPWVATAAVSRRWPNTLYVSISEQQPIARWGDSGFLNNKGEFIAVDHNEFLRKLPLLDGNSGQEKAMMHDYQELTQLLRPHDFRVTEFHSDKLLSRTIVLNNGLTLTIGRDQVVERVQRFLTVYKASLESRIKKVASVDLRYGNGVAVEWKSSATAESSPSDRDGQQNNQA